MKRMVATPRGSSGYRFSSIRISTCVVLGIFSLAVWAERVPPGTDEEITTRLEPFGHLCKKGQDCGEATAAASSGPRSGQQIYDKTCTICHAAGVSGAPRLGSAEDWGPRIDQGMEVLWSHTLNGLNVMPPRGTCMDCSDDELRAALEYMVKSI